MSYQESSCVCEECNTSLDDGQDMYCDSCFEEKTSGCVNCGDRDKNLDYTCDHCLDDIVEDQVKEKLKEEVDKRVKEELAKRAETHGLGLYLFVCSDCRKGRVKYTTPDKEFKCDCGDMTAKAKAKIVTEPL